MTDLRARIYSGMALLDEFDPDWRHCVMVDYLDMSEPTFDAQIGAEGKGDVLAMVHAGDGIGESFAMYDHLGLTEASAVEYGFDIPMDDAMDGRAREAYAELTAAWKEALQ